MDLNYLFTRHQTSLMRADRAGCRASRAAHLGLAAGYAASIDALQDRSGASHRRDALLTADAAAARAIAA